MLSINTPAGTRVRNIYTQQLGTLRVINEGGRLADGQDWASVIMDHDGESWCGTLGAYEPLHLVGTELLGEHTHHIDGMDERCDELDHCPSICSCPIDACDAAPRVFPLVVPVVAPAGRWTQRRFNGRGSRTPHYTLPNSGRVAVCGFDLGAFLLDEHTPYAGDRRCGRCASWVARHEAVTA